MRFLPAVSALLIVPLGVRASSGLDGAERLTFQSTVLGEQRVLAVVTPASYRQGTERYPVLYLTDAESQMGHLRATAEFLARNGLAPELVLVGILNTARTRDLTPTPGTKAEQAAFPTAGGGERFLDFLDKELVPAIEARYRTVPLRLFAGHSFGGLLGIHALLTRPRLFSVVIAASPALSWDDFLMVRQARALKTGAAPTPRALFVTVGGLEASPEVVEDFQDFARAMQRMPWPDFDWAWQMFPGEDHGSSVLPGDYAGLRHIFAGWAMPPEDEHGAPPSLAVVRRHYLALSQRWGYSVLPPEGVINAMGYAALGRRETASAIDFFRFNVDAHQEAANAHDSLGEALEQAGELSAARACYRRALGLAVDTGSDSASVLRAHLRRVEERIEQTSR
jgi:predicted alpha/beta superfamily hydrolase